MSTQLTESPNIPFLPSELGTSDTSESANNLSAKDSNRLKVSGGHPKRLAWRAGRLAILGLWLMVILYPVLAVGLSLYMQVFDRPPTLRKL